MFCKNCGKKLEDGAAFYPDCGAAVSGQTGDVLQSALNAQPPAPTGPSAADYAPAGGGKGPELEPDKPRKGWILPAAIGCVAVVCILAAVLLSGLFGGAKGDLTKAMAKSVNAWQAVSDSLELPDLAALQKERKVSQSFTVQLKNISDALGAEAKMLEGMSVSFAGGTDLPGRKLNFSLAASYGPAELFSMQLWGEDEIMTLACPAFLGEQTYGVNTETLGRDLDRLLPDSDAADISFNIFDIMEVYAKSMEVDPAATKALTDAIEVEKAGTATVETPCASMKCDDYLVTIPQEAMLDYLDAVRTAYDAQARNEAMLDIMGSLGTSADELEAMEEQLRDVDIFEDLEEALRESDDLTLNVYVNDGYIASAAWEGAEESLRVCFGGRENYVDDIYLDVSTEDGRFTLTSSGNHDASNSAFTDNTVMTVESGFSGSVSLESQLSYDPKQPSDNFSWTLSTNGVSLAAKGQLTGGTDSLFLDLDQLSVSALGVEYARLGVTWSVGPYDFSGSSLGTPVMLSDMTTDDLESLYYDVVINSQNWVLGLANQVPELFRLFM